MKAMIPTVLAVALLALAVTAIPTHAQSIYTPYAFTNFAGMPKELGNADGTGSAARFAYPGSVALDSAGNVYVADPDNNTIRKGYPAPRILNSGPAFGFNGGQFPCMLTAPT